MGTETIRDYEIAGLAFRVIGDHTPGMYLSGYQSSAADACQQIELLRTQHLSAPGGSLAFRDPEIQIYRNGSEEIRFVGSTSDDPTRGYLRIGRSGARTTAEFSGSGPIMDKMVIQAMELPHALTRHDGVVLHASCVIHDGRAILFTAPSETGKSTQAELWCRHRGAELVNGDRAAIRVLGEGVTAFGIPISGSSPVRKNLSAPLGAIVYLSQAPENTITRLRGVRAFRRVWEGCTINAWDRENVDLASKTVSAIIGQTPVYHLSCTPDVRAVELLNHTMEVDT